MQGARVINSDEVKKMLTVKNPRNRMLVLVGLYFGTRISETVALRFGDFKGKYVRIKSVKRSNDRTLEIPAEFRKELDDLRSWYLAKGCAVNDESPLFLSQKKTKDGSCKPISKQFAVNVIQGIRDAQGLDERVSAHSFRKNFTTTIYKLCEFNIMQTAISKYTTKVQQQS